MRHLNKHTFTFSVCAVLAAFFPSQVMAHPMIETSNAFAGGFFHSFTGLDHALAMVGVGVLSTKLLRSDILLLPLTFLIFLAIGAGLGYFGFELRFAETAIALSCLVLGSCILSSKLQRYRRSIFGIVAGFATVHGYVHLIELPAGFSASQFTFGFLSASAIMHITGVFIGEAFKDKEHLWLMRIFGSAMIVFGILFLIGSFRVEAPATSSLILEREFHMRVFITGGSGFIGTALINELIRSRHQVLALARTGESAAKLKKMGAEIQMGSLEDFESLRKGAAATDGVIHLGFVHGLSKVSILRRLGIIFGGITRGMMSFGETAVGVDIRAIEAIGSQLEGTNRPFVNVLGSMTLKHGKLGTEKDTLDTHGFGGIRSKSERAMFALIPKGVHAMAVCFPPTVHGDDDKGFVPHMIAAAKKHRVSAYVDDGQNRCPAVHRLDAVQLLSLVLENGKAGVRYHSMAEEGIRLKDIATVIGRKLNIPVVSRSNKEAEKHFSLLTPFFSADNPASSRRTQEQLGWKPTRPGLIADLENGSYFDVQIPGTSSR